MESALRALLTGYAPLTDLVGGSSTPRIYWGDIPQGAADPCVNMYVIDGVPGTHMQGSDNLTPYTVQINVRALTVTSCWEVRDAIRDRLNHYKGIVGNVWFQGIFPQGARGPREEKPGTVVYRTFQLDFLVWAGTIT